MEKEWTPEQIKDLRARLGMTVEQFAREMGGVTVSAVKSWECGARNPSATARGMMSFIDPGPDAA